MKIKHQAFKLDKDIQRLLDTKGFPYVVDQLHKWVINKHDHTRAYQPEDKEELNMYRLILSQLNTLMMSYK